MMQEQAAAAVTDYCTNFREKQVKEKEKKKEESVWNLDLKEEKT